MCAWPHGLFNLPHIVQYYGNNIYMLSLGAKEFLGWHCKTHLYKFRVAHYPFSRISAENSFRLDLFLSVYMVDVFFFYLSVNIHVKKHMSRRICISEQNFKLWLLHISPSKATTNGYSEPPLRIDVCWICWHQNLQISIRSDCRKVSLNK